MGGPSESSYSFQAVYCVIIGIPNVILVLEKSQFLTVVHILTDLLVPELLLRLPDRDYPAVPPDLQDPEDLEVLADISDIAL